MSCVKVMTGGSYPGGKLCFFFLSWFVGNHVFTIFPTQFFSSILSFFIRLEYLPFLRFSMRTTNSVKILFQILSTESRNITETLVRMSCLQADIWTQNSEYEAHMFSWQQHLKILIVMSGAYSKDEVFFSEHNSSRFHFCSCDGCSPPEHIIRHVGRYKWTVLNFTNSNIKNSTRTSALPSPLTPPVPRPPSPHRLIKLITRCPRKTKNNINCGTRRKKLCMWFVSEMRDLNT